MHKNLSAGLGTTNFTDEILDIFGSLDRAGKQKLIDYSGHLVAEQRGERRVEQRVEQHATA